MCEECVSKAAEIDPRIFKLMEEVRPQIEALKALLSIEMRDILDIEIVNEEGDEPELEPAVKAEIAETMAKLSGILGIAYAIGWNVAVKCDGPMELAMHVSPMMGMLNRSLDEGFSYNYVINQRKH